MAKEQVIDTAPEMDVAEMEAMLATSRSESPAAKPDVKSKAGSSPVATAVILEEKEAPTTAEDAEARIRGLQAELARRKGNAERVEQLETELSYMKGQLDTLTKSKPSSDPIGEAVQKLDDETLITRQTEWEEELSSLRSKFDRAEELRDDSAMADLGQKIAQARKIIKAIRIEDKVRGERKQSDRDRQTTEGQVLKDELDTMFQTVLENHPDFQNEDSELWKAGNEQFNTYPLLMSRLGPAAQIVAAAMAVINNPELAGAQGSTAVRREVISKIDKGLSHALSTGTKGTPGRTAAPDYSVETGADLANFNRVVDRYKGG